MPAVEERFAGSWDDLRPLVRGELDRYLAYAPTIDQDLPTRCPPWTVRDVTRHLAATFERFCDMLERGRSGSYEPPFARDEMDAENLRAVAEFPGDAHADARLAAAAERFLTMADDPDEVMPHQRGPIPVGVQMLFGLEDLAIHHDDVAVAAGASYEPPAEVVDAMVAAYRRLGWWDEADAPVWAEFVRGRGE